MVVMTYETSVNKAELIFKSATTSVTGDKNITQRQNIIIIATRNLRRVGVNDGDRAEFY